MTCQSATPPISLAQGQSDRQSPSDRLHTIRHAQHPSDCPSLSNCLYTILPHLSGCPTLSDHASTINTSLSDHPPPSHCLYGTPTSPSDHLPPPHHLYNTPISPSACPSPANCLTATTTHPPVRPSSHTIHCTQDSIHSLAVVNGSNHTQFTVHKIRATPSQS